MPARYFVALRIKAALGPNSELVSAVMMVPSASSMAEQSTPLLSLRSLAATTHLRSSTVILAWLSSTLIFLTSFSLQPPSAMVFKAVK